MKSQLSEFPRILHLELRDHNAAFLWGPRKVAKTTLLRQQFAAARYIDLLQSDLKTSLLLRPSLLREEVAANHYDLVVVDLDVDLVIGDLDLAVEFKASRKVDERDLKGLRALMDDQRVRQAAVVSQDPVMRSLPGGVTVYPWQQFCQKLWAGDLLT